MRLSPRIFPTKGAQTLRYSAAQPFAQLLQLIPKDEINQKKEENTVKNWNMFLDIQGDTFSV